MSLVYGESSDSEWFGLCFWLSLGFFWNLHACIVLHWFLELYVRWVRSIGLIWALSLVHLGIVLLGFKVFSVNFIDKLESIESGSS